MRHVSQITTVIGKYGRTAGAIVAVLLDVRDAETGVSVVSQAALAARTGLSVTWVCHWLKVLTDGNVLSRFGRRDKFGYRDVDGIVVNGPGLKERLEVLSFAMARLRRLSDAAAVKFKSRQHRVWKPTSSEVGCITKQEIISYADAVVEPSSALLRSLGRWKVIST